MTYVIWPPPGTVIFIWFLGIFRHKGIVSDLWWNGKPMVIANSWDRHGVAEISWDAFAGNQQVFVDGYPSDLSPPEVLYNARSMIGDRYDALLSNCEHFVCKCHGLEPHSPQAAAVVFVAAIAAIVVAGATT
jgi:hypothetical protein